MSESYLHHALNGAVLDQEQARSVFEQMSRGELSDIEIAAFLGALHARGEQPSEIAGAAEAFRQAAQSFSTDATGIIDVVGTGGDGVGTINISTASAFVAASMGLSVAKHGNRAVSSKAGAADLIEAAGIPLDLSPASSAQLLERTGFCFLFAQKYHPAMRFVAPVRAALKNPTIFNLIGPLVNPAHLSYQVLGVGKRELLDDVAQALASLGLEHALVVHGSGTDEFAVHGQTEVREITREGISAFTCTPEELGITPAPLSDLIGGDASDNLRLVTDIFNGSGVAAQRDAIAATTGAMLYLGGKVPSLSEGSTAALAQLASGAVTEHLQTIASTAQELKTQEQQ
mgnify:FL=1